jgi:putative flippase GtrA
MAFSRFVIAGVFNTGIGYLIYLAFLYLMPYLWAYSITYILGIGLGYLLNIYWVFKKKPNLRNATAYPLTYGINYLFGTIVLWLLVELMHISKKIAPLIVVVVSVPVMYGLIKSIFKGKSLS